MTETIESFLAKLQSEGVQAGREQAEKLLEQARQQAEQALEQANAEAERIVEDARGRAKAALDQGQTELDLAVRDSVMRLQGKVQAATEALIAAAVQGQLSDGQFLRPLLHDVVMQYVRAETEQTNLVINLEPRMRQALADWAIQQLVHQSPQGRLSVELRGALKAAGFECRCDGATIEVTTQSVAEALGEMVSPAIQTILQNAAAERPSTTGDR